MLPLLALLVSRTPVELVNEWVDTPSSRTTIESRYRVTPFHQWNTNDGYCGEVSALQAGLNSGQWMSQYNSRLICGTGLSQSGPDGYCATNGNIPNYNAQVLLELPMPGDSTFASAGLCLKNARLDYVLFASANQPDGMAGYESYLSWIKAQVLAGNQVTIGVLNQYGSDAQYDHEVSVTRIGTNYAFADTAYHGEDVLFFDDHTAGGTPYKRGYTFASLAKSRRGANSIFAHRYSILIPGGAVTSGAGGDGRHAKPGTIRASNYGFAVKGPLDPGKETLPVTLAVTGSTTDGEPNRPMKGAGFYFENPGLESECTNTPPRSWMGITLRVTVSGLDVGKAYNLYRYDFNGVSGVGEQAALQVPDSNFNAHAGESTSVKHFVATETTLSEGVETTSDKIIVFRAVPADGP
jgi:hypothetical protein